MSHTSSRRTTGNHSFKTATIQGGARVAPQVETDAGFYAAELSRSLQRASRHITKTKSQRVGRRASLLRCAAVLRTLADEHGYIVVKVFA